LSVNWTFSLGVTAEALRAKIDKTYKCEKRASNIALSYGVDVDK